MDLFPPNLQRTPLLIIQIKKLASKQDSNSIHHAVNVWLVIALCATALPLMKSSRNDNVHDYELTKRRFVVIFLNDTNRNFGVY